MALYTLDQARQHLQAWMDADLAVSTGKEYYIGTRRLRRADTAEISERIRFWSREVQRLEGGTRVRRIVPYDL